MERSFFEVDMAVDAGQNSLNFTSEHSVANTTQDGSRMQTETAVAARILDSKECFGELQTPKARHEQVSRDAGMPRCPIRVGAVGGGGAVGQTNRQAMTEYGVEMGRSFRVGWGPGGVLVHSAAGQLNVPAVSPEGGQLELRKISTFVPTPDTDSVTVREKIEGNLKLHIRHQHQADAMDDDSSDRDGDGCDRQNRFIGEYVQHCSVAEKNVWQLVKCLFCLTDASHNGATALSKWLQSVVAEATPEQKTNIVHLLARKRIDDACNLALENKNYRLAMLIAQADGDPQMRSLVKEQVVHWKQGHGAERYWDCLDTTQQHVYSILSGSFDINESSVGLPQEDLGWRRNFGLHLWYQSPSYDVAKALDLYTDSCDRGAAVKPMPRMPRIAAHASAEDHPQDVEYILIDKKFRTDAQDAETVLDPRSCTAQQAIALDYAFTWQLQRFLLDECRGCGFEGYHQRSTKSGLQKLVRRYALPPLLRERRAGKLRGWRGGAGRGEAR
jgi:nuclear pore complex protein Nup98-Nup96